MSRLKQTEPTSNELDVGYLGEVIAYPPVGMRSVFEQSDPCDEQLPSYSKERKGE